MDRWKEITVYVHGISPGCDVTHHTGDYKKLESNINKELKPNSLGMPVMIEWGWGGSSGEDKNLAKVERKIADMFWNAYKKACDFPLHPWQLIGARAFVKKLRDAFLYGIADMFYYVSEDGKRTVRATVFNEVLRRVRESLEKEEIEVRMGEEDAHVGISLTCIGHSAGTVILHDLLFALFTKKYESKLPASVAEAAKDSIEYGRNLFKQGKLRLRKFCTFGSPITPLTFRSNSLIQQADAAMGDGSFLDMQDIGIVDYPGASNPRWINIWDPDDAIAYPVSFLYRNSEGVIADKCIDVSDNPFKAHGAYWGSGRVAKEIANSY